MENEYIKCPGCKKSINGATLYECQNCGNLMCFYSSGLPLSSSKGCWKSDRCPNCASHRKVDEIAIIKPIGKIYSK